MKKIIFIIVLGISIIIFLMILVLWKLDLTSSEMENKYLRSQSENYFLAEKLIELSHEVDSLKKGVIILNDKLDKKVSYKTKIPTIDTTKHVVIVRRASKLNQYGPKSLPSRFRKNESGWIEYCGTKYNPVPSQCYGSGKKTSTGASTAELIANPNYWGVAVTLKSLQNGFRMHDTIEIQYMTVDGQWRYVLNSDSIPMKGIIEDRMNPRFNKFCCIDILTSKEQMKELPFTGLAKVRIRKL